VQNTPHLATATSDLSCASENLIALTSELIAIEDCPIAELAPVLHISQIALNRVHEQVKATLFLYQQGHWAAFEALSRVATEYCVRLEWLMQNDPRQTFGYYFFQYFAESKKYQLKHRKLLEQRNDHEELKYLAKAEKELAFREDAMRGYADFCGFTLSDDFPLKSVLSVFKQLDRTNDYRGLYSALSSQIHADAGSLVDYVITQCMEWPNELKAIQLEEVRTWMAYFLAKVVNSHSVATMSWAQRFGFAVKLSEIEDIRRSIELPTSVIQAVFGNLHRRAREA